MVRGIVWFRNDLRLHDNEALTDAIRTCEEVLPVYIFDIRIFRGYTKYGFRKADRHRIAFIIECIQNLSDNLKAIGLKLYIRVGKPEEEIYNLAQDVKSSWVFCNRERTQEEVNVQDKLEDKLWTIGQEIRYYRGKMLYHTADLPFPVTHTPDIFTNFRKEVEKFVKIRKPLPSPMASDVRPISISLDFGEIPSLSDFNLSSEEGDIKVVEGGESAALAQLDKYLWETHRVKDYFNTRNQLLGNEFSTRLSAYLAKGCISPKYVYDELKRYEAAEGSNKSTYWVFFELLWRDFFRLIGKKYGNTIFQEGGTAGRYEKEFKEDWQQAEKWMLGQTGIPFIDANMIELNRTGFMSNRGRQNVASFFINDLKQHWLIGAEYFESLLIDYDPCSNYGNWNYIAGVGADPRENRYFNILSQARKYDSDGSYVKHWIPQLQSLDTSTVHHPSVNQVENYVEAMVPFETWRR